MYDIRYGLGIGCRTRATAVYSVMYVRQFVGYTIRLKKNKPVSDIRNVLVSNNVYNVAPGRRSTVCTDDYTSVELNGHNRGLIMGISGYPPRFFRQQHTYTEVDLTGLETLHIHGVHS